MFHIEPSGQNRSYSPDIFIGSCECTTSIRLFINVSAVAFVRFSATRLPLIYTSYIVPPIRFFFVGRSCTVFLGIGFCAGIFGLFWEPRGRPRGRLGVGWVGAMCNLFLDPSGRPRLRGCATVDGTGGISVVVAVEIRALFLEPRGRPRGRLGVFDWDVVGFFGVCV